MSISPSVVSKQTFPFVEGSVMYMLDMIGGAWKSYSNDDIENDKNNFVFGTIQWLKNKRILNFIKINKMSN